MRKQLEVDFVCNSGSRKCCIQSAYSLPTEETRSLETRPFSKIDDSFKRIVVTGDIIPAYYDDAGILTISVYDFLANPSLIEGQTAFDQIFLENLTK